MTKLTRVIVDECVGAESALVKQFRQTLAPTELVEFVHLAELHRGIPDVELLRRLLGPDTILLTTDRKLHNQACALGFRSCTLNEQGQLRRKKLAGIPVTKPVETHSSGELKSDYVRPAHPLTRALQQGMNERAFNNYRTRRRRIRSYFGSEANIASTSLTIGAKATAKGWMCGYFLKVAGKSGVKGIQASEGYGITQASSPKPTWCLLHALRELYLLQLESIPAQLYIIPPASLVMCEGLLKPTGTAEQPADAQALHRLLQGLAGVQVLPCVKGPFFERMVHKFHQLASSGSNELVTVAFDQMINALQISPILTSSDRQG